MADVAVRFALSSNRADAAGFLYVEALEHLVETGRISGLVRGKNVAELLGGYLFLIEGRVWNSYDRIPFTPEHLRMGTDTLAFSALLIEQLATQIDEHVISCDLSEMSTLRIEFVSRREATIAGLDVDGNVAYSPERIVFENLVKGLVSATAAFLDVADQSQQVDAANSSQANERNRMFLDRWRGNAARLNTWLLRGN